MQTINPLELAQKIVRGSYINISDKQTFTETSGIYRFTNENITAYFHHLQNKEKVLSVISSGNHILNSILAGTKSIDCFDISIFPEYYLYLQIASIMALSKEDYLKYYLSDDKEEKFSDVFYDEITNNLNGKYKSFWDRLYMFDDGIDIYESLLFRQDICSKSDVIDKNPYLQDNNYEKLKHILKTKNIVINPITANIINTKFDKQYDLVILSNILAYYFGKENLDEYINYFKNNFNLTNNGEIINYFYNINSSNIEICNNLLSPNGYIEDINGKKLLVFKKLN